MTGNKTYPDFMRCCPKGPKLKKLRKKPSKLNISYEASGKFKGISLDRADCDVSVFASLCNQFFQCLHDNLYDRFPCDDLMSAIAVLDPNELPQASLARALFGNSEVGMLFKLLKFKSEDSADIIAEYQRFKIHKIIVSNSKLQQLYNRVLIFPYQLPAVREGLVA